MSMLSPSAHRLLDFVTVALFATAPAILGLSGAPATLSYALAAVHLLVTAATAFPGTSGRRLPMPVHGAIEGVVGIVLAALPWVAGWLGTARIFYTVMGGVILVVWLGTRYRA